MGVRLSSLHMTSDLDSAPKLAPLTIEAMKSEATVFVRELSVQPIAELYNVSDGKAVGTYVEHAFKNWLALRYSYEHGNSANGLDLPSINTDIKVTSIARPQSSSPFKSAWQEIGGMGYNLMVFVYEKKNNPRNHTSILDFRNAIFIDRSRTADYRLTKNIREVALDEEMSDEVKADEIEAILMNKQLPVDDATRRNWAEQLVHEPPEQGAITVSNALQWRLAYNWAIELAAKRTYRDTVVDLA